MKIYKVSLTYITGDPDTHAGYQYFASKREAKRGIIAALNRHGSHPDNG